ncbi:AT-hook motif nuclear-localized protein 10 [Capsicum annuum]|uniref:AT-hook motif nuclear-localized protein n=1 Tax=Capsicum annuum TaxID=4072 RepID=A0A2G3APH5_CAPAN|nr:AT-hook motif nuclear-localized protein 10 [Capsicum annuum]
MDSRNHPQRQPQPHHHQSLPESHELEQPVSDMAHLIVSFNQHQQLNLRQNPISSVSALTPVVNQADSIAIAPVLSENLVKKPRERPWAPERRSNQKLQDIVSKIMTILDQGPPAICILFAAGSLCEATLCNSAIGTMTHEGQFDIISLTGSFMRSENGITGGLNLSMTRPDGRFFGGVVEGKLRAATPVQVVVRSFFPDMEKPESKPPSSTPTPNVLNFDPPVSKAASPSTPSSTHLM